MIATLPQRQYDRSQRENMSRKLQMVSQAEAVKEKHLVEYFSDYFDSRRAMGNSIGGSQRETTPARGTKRQRPSNNDVDQEKSRIEEENLSTPRR